MLKTISFSVLFVLFILNPSTQTHASTEKEKEIIVETQPQSFTPAITLNPVYGTFSDVISVKIYLIEADLEIPLSNLGNRTWQAKLTSDEVQDLLSDSQSEEYTAKIITRSKNDKGRIESKEEIVKLVIKS